MNARIRQIHLLSPRPQELASFLMSLFDMECLETGERDAIVIGSQEQSFAIEKSDHDKSLGQSLLIDLEFQTPDELQHLLQKIEFVHYRTQTQRQGPSPKIVQIKDRLSLTFFDLDDRKWIFSSPAA